MLMYRSVAALQDFTNALDNFLGPEGPWLYVRVQSLAAQVFLLFNNPPIISTLSHLTTATLLTAKHILLLAAGKVANTTNRWICRF